VRTGSDGRNESTGSGRNNGPNGTNDGGRHSGRTGGAGRTWRGHPRWVLTAVTSVAVFLIAMIVITLIEFGTGKPIGASLWGQKASGTTLGNVTGGGTSSKSTVQPTTPATPGTSATPSQSASPGVNSSVQPTSGATSAPSPSAVPSVGATNPARTTPATTGATPPSKATQ